MLTYKKIILFFIIATATGIAKTYLRVNSLRNTLSIFNEQTRHLSPLQGALLSESGLLLDIYKSDSNSATTNLAKKLFYLNWNQFYPTVARNHPASYFDGEDIAELIIIAETNGEIENSDALKVKLCAKAEQAYPEEFRKTPFRKHLNKVINLIKESLAECTPGPAQKHPEYTTQAILLSYLYQKADSKKDIFKYIVRLSKYMNILKNNRLLAESELQQIWLNVDYKKQDYFAFEDIIARQSLDQIGKNTLLKQYIATSLIVLKNYYIQAPQVPQGYFQFKDGKEIVADCQETAIREFCNAIFFNRDTKKFDLEKFPQLNFSPEILAFYSDIQRDPTLVKDSRVGQVWYNMISGKPGVEYVNGDYNMRPTIPNFVNTINHLFGLNATDLGELTSVISNDQFEIYHDHTTLETPDGIADVISFICIDMSGDTPKQFTINIHMIPDWPNWHAWTTFEYQANNNDFANTQLRSSPIEHIINSSTIGAIAKASLLKIVSS